MSSDLNTGSSVGLHLSHDCPLSKEVKDEPKEENVYPEFLEETYYTDKGEEKKCLWKLGKFLGTGSTSKVYELTNLSTNLVYAGKFYNKSRLQKDKDRNILKTEIRILRSLSNEFIVKYKTHFEGNDFYVIVLELCQKKTMAELLKARKRLTETEVRYYLKQVISALEYLHRNRVIHRDIKPGNLFLASNLEIKLGDFGLSEQLTYDSQLLTKCCGTPNYIAPEVLYFGEHGYSYTADVWSFGVLMYTLLYGKAPFETSDVNTTYKRIKEAIFYFPERISVSEDAKDLIRKILVKEPEERISLEQIKEHSFFTNHFIPLSLPDQSLVMEPKF